MKKTTAFMYASLISGVFAACSSDSTPAENEKSAQTADSTAATTEAKTEEESEPQAPAEKPKKTKSEHQFVLGKWTGTLRDKKLTIVIESIQGNDVTGYNIAGKNKRPLQGKIMEDDRMIDGECGGNLMAYKVVLNEPGDDKWDGTFTLYFVDCPVYDDQVGNILSHSYSVDGSWRAFSGKLSGDVMLSK
jgi:hypothetical protein